MKLKILSIDDSKSVQSFLGVCVQKFTEVYMPLPNGPAALEHFKVTPLDFYDLIFLDWEMPEMEGPEVFANLLELGVRAPVFMLTSRNSEDDIASLLSLGVTDYLMKPFTEDIIESKLLGLFGDKIYE